MNASGYDVVAEESPASRNGKEHHALTLGLQDFYAYMPAHNYLCVPSRETWPAASVNATIPPIPTGHTDERGKAVYISASTWLDQKRAVQQMTWAPGESLVICNRVMQDGGWVPEPGWRCFNLYRAPELAPGDATRAGPWLGHVSKLFDDEGDHLLNWLAHRVQKPQQKINHAIVMGGRQGIGKDTILEPVKYAVGPWNFQDITPSHLLGRFNAFVKSVILRVNEARDLGDIDRFAFYDRSKMLIAAPPDVIRCDEKNMREYSVPNVCGVIITTNHKSDGIFLPAEDRRHYVLWSDRAKEEFSPEYFVKLYEWFRHGGAAHVAAYLGERDLSGFDHNAPPPKTAAFWAIVDASRAPEDADLADIIDKLQNPDAITLRDVIDAVGADGKRDDFFAWLRDPRHRRKIPHRFEDVGYISIRNPHAKDGLWKLHGRRQVIYARADLSYRDQHIAVKQMVDASY